MRGAAAAVDVRSVGLVVDDKGLSAESVENSAGDHPGAAVCAVQGNLAVLEGLRCNISEVTDVTVPSGVVIHRAADVLTGRERNLLNLAVDVFFNGILQLIIHLLAVAVHQLDAVVGVRVVACADHDTAVKTVGSRDVRNAGRRRYMQQVGVRARSRDAGSQRILVHIGRAARILADDNLRLAFLAVVPSEVTSDGKCMLCCQVHSGLSAESVSTEILTHNQFLLITDFGRRGVRRNRILILTVVASLIAHEDDIVVQVEEGRRAAGGNRALEHLYNSVVLILAVCKDDNLLCGKNRSHTHGKSVRRNIGCACEETCVGVDGVLGKLVTWVTGTSSSSGSLNAM